MSKILSLYVDLDKHTTLTVKRDDTGMVHIHTSVKELDCSAETSVDMTPEEWGKFLEGLTHDHT